MSAACMNGYAEAEAGGVCRLCRTYLKPFSKSGRLLSYETDDAITRATVHQGLSVYSNALIGSLNAQGLGSSVYRERTSLSRTPILRKRRTLGFAGERRRALHRIRTDDLFLTMHPWRKRSKAYIINVCMGFLLLSGLLILLVLGGLYES